MTDVRITGLRVRSVIAPLTLPIRTASGVVSSAPLVLIDLETSAGITGCAYLFTYTPVVLKSVTALVESVADLITGKPLAPVALEQELKSRFRLLGYTGLVQMALAGVEMAAWDALAKLSELPLVRLLGGERRALPTYDSHSMDGIDLAVERALASQAQGFRALKTKIGYATLQEDLQVVGAIRKAVGGNLEIMVDYNQSLSVPEAIRRGRALQDLGVSWIEEPTHQQDNAGHHKIATQLDTPIQIGENWFGVEEMFPSCMAAASDLVMIDVMKIGGVSGWIRAASIAERFALPVSSHIFQEISAHLLTITPGAHWLERMDLAGAVTDPLVTFKDGMAHVSDEPGAGVRWNESQVEKYLV